MCARISSQIVEHEMAKEASAMDHKPVLGRVIGHNRVQSELFVCNFGLRVRDVIIKRGVGMSDIE